MANNITVAITADVADLTAKMAIARADVQATNKTLNDLAKTARTSGMTQELQASLMAAGDASAKATSEAARLTREMKRYAPAAAEAMHGSAGVTRELLVMGRELSRGNFNRMAGSATILSGRLGILTPSVLMTAGAVAALAAPFIAFGIAAEQGSREAAHFKNVMEATGGYAGVTQSQLQNLAHTMANWAHTGIGAANEALMKVVATGHFSGNTMLLVGEDAVRMGQLTGESAEKFITEFDKMKSGVAKFAQEYQDQYHQLTTAQYTYIRQLEEQGHKEQAEYELAKDVYEYLGKQAPQNLGYLERALNGVAHAWSAMWDSAKAWGRNSNQDQIDELTQHISLLKKDPAAAKGGEVTQEIRGLETQLRLVQQREAADQRSAENRAKQASTQTEGADAAARLAEKFEASKTSGEKLHIALQKINDDLAKAKAADPGNASMYEAQAAAARAQAEKSDTPHAPKAKDDTVAKWTEELRAKQIASNDYFSDATADELKFWQSKVALTTKGSKDWLEVQARIFEASRTLARQAYQDQIANLNEKIAADRDNWAKEQADLRDKVALAEATHKEQSREYKDALKELETAQREHDDKELATAAEHGRRVTEELKRQLDLQAKARDDDAKGAETVIKADAGSTPFGEIAAQRQLAELHRQVAEQKIADNETYYASEKATLDAAIAAAEARYGEEKAKYQNLIDAKMAADQQYAAKKQELDAQLREKSIQDSLAMQNAYAGYISGTVNATVTGFSKMIGGQMTWRNLGISIYQSFVREAEQQIEKMVTNWIVEHLFMSAQQRAELAQQKAAQAAATAAQTTATTTSVAAQTSATISGGAAQTAAMLATTKAQVALLAGLAGAGGVASMAAAPFPLDLTAPAFGAEMAANAIALGSFAQGTNIVPNDMVAQIHAGERIIPRGDNAALLELTARGSAGGSGGGATHYHTHYSPEIHGQMPFADQLAAHEDNVISMLQRAARRGVRFS